MKGREKEREVGSGRREGEKGDGGERERERYLVDIKY